MSALPEDRNFYGAYRTALSGGRHDDAEAGRHHRAEAGTGPKLTLTVVAAMDGVGGAAAANPACASAVAQPDDTTDNRRSVAFVLRYGALISLTAATSPATSRRSWPPDRPRGAVDLYQVTHHGQANSNNPVLLATLKPTVAVMNGPRKGAAETFQRLWALPSLKGLFAIHKNASTGPEGIAREHRQPRVARRW